MTEDYGDRLADAAARGCGPQEARAYAAGRIRLRRPRICPVCGEPEEDCGCDEEEP